MWLMEKGEWTKPGVRLYTSFSKFEQLDVLVVLLKRIFNIDSTIQKINYTNIYYIYIKGNSVVTLRNVIYPYTLPCMLYKLGL